METHKECKTCGCRKELVEFHRHNGRGSTHGRKNHCKGCTNSKNKIQREKNRDRVLEVRELSRVKRLYGLTPEMYAEVRTITKCAICNSEETRDGKLAIDHCHSTGKFRGMLCHKCNMALGLFGDDIEVMSNAIEYLKQHTLGG